MEYQELNSMLYKLAISGKAGVGKDKFASLLQKYAKSVNIKFKKYAFADPVKKIARIMFPNLPKSYLYGPSKNRSKIIPGAIDKNNNPLTCRKLLTDIGTDVGRNYKETIWIDVFDHNLSKLQNCIFLVKDVRFTNEFDHLKENDFIMFRIKRNSSAISNHISETDLDNITDDCFDYVIDNNGSLYDLECKAYSIMEFIINKR